MSFVTVNVLQALPLHNLNRDQNGLPKSQYDGGVQRARLSSQSLKRPARMIFRESVASLGSNLASTRTKNAHEIVADLAEKYAADHDSNFDRKQAATRAKKVIGALAANSEKGEDKKDSILLFSDAELETLARAIVDESEADDKALTDAFLLDFRSPALDVAAFGRMFAQRADLSTQAAVAVSHAVTTHQAKFTIDYFTAVDEHDEEDREDAGAAHLGLSYFTSGVYYRSFTIDTDQLRRSWSGFDGDTAYDQVRALVEALVKALPSGRLTNTNAHTVPFLLYVEEQKSRVSYEFETPVHPNGDGDAGGYKVPSVEALARQVQLARRFDPDNVMGSAVWGDTFGADFGATTMSSLDELTAFVADAIFKDQR